MHPSPPPPPTPPFLLDFCLFKVEYQLFFAAGLRRSSAGFYRPYMRVAQIRAYWQGEAAMF